MVSQPQQMTYALPLNSRSLPLQQRMIRALFRTLGSIAPRATAQLAFKVMLSPRRYPLSAKGKALLDSAQQVSIPFPSGALAGYVWGDGPQTVMLVHGWEANASQFRVLISHLLEAGYRVAAFDAPAQGRSPGKEANLFSIGESIQAALEYFGPVHAIIAHSFGAAATLYLLGTTPELSTNKLVLNGSPAGIPHIMEQFAYLIDLPQAAIAQMYDLFIRRFSRPASRFSMSHVAPRITIPTLMLHDQQDRFVPYAQGLEISQNWPAAQFVTTNGLGHRGALRDAETLRKVLAFIDD